MGLANEEELQRGFLRLQKELGNAITVAVREAFEDFGLRWTEAMKRRVRSGGGRFDRGSVGGLSPGSPPRSRSGRLRNSFRSRIRGTKLRNVALSLFSTAGVVAWVQEFGTKGKEPGSPIATIRPKGDGWLTIPLPGALTAGGRLRKGAREARDFKNTFFVRGKKGGLVLMQASGRFQDKITPIFRLVKKVDLRARLGMRETFDKQVDRHLFRDLSDAVQKELGRAGGRTVG